MSSLDYSPILLEIAVLGTALYFVSLPLYIYGIKKWINNRRHIVIYKRFPAISDTIIFLSIINCHLIPLLRWIQYDHGASDYKPDSNKYLIGNFLWRLIIRTQPATSYFIYGLTTLRIFLIYLRSKQQNQMSTSSQAAIKIVYYYHWYSLTVLFVSIIGFFVLSIFHIIGSDSLWIRLNSVFWVLMLILSIFCVILIVKNKATDGIGCLKETATMSLYVFIISMLAPLMTLDDVVLYVCMVIFTITPYVQGIFSLYYPLYIIYKIEGTLNRKQHKKRSSISLNMANVHELYVVKSSISIIDTLDTRTTPLHEFLEKEMHYNAFVEYLQYCWAIENLLFIQNVCIVSQIVIEYKQLYTNCDDNDKQSLTDLHFIKFAYLDDIHMEFKKELNKLTPVNSDNDDDNNFEYFKNGFHLIYRKIYNEYISTGSPTEINVSSITRATLKLLLQDDNNIHKFKSFDDYLSVFDNASMEIFALLLSLYSYGFHQFVQSPTPSE